MKITRNRLRQLIKESIDKQTKDLTKKAGADIPDEIESDFGGGEVAQTGSDFSFDIAVETSRRKFLKIMSGIAAAIGIGGAATIASRSSSRALGKTDEELFADAGFRKERNMYIPHAGYEGEPIDMGGHHYIKVEEIMSGTTVTIKIYPVAKVEGAYASDIEVNWNSQDDLGYVADYNDENRNAYEMLDYIRGTGLNNIMDAYMAALEDKQNMALEAIQRAEEVYQGHEPFDLNDKDNYNVYDTYGDGEINYWWEHFIHVFGVPTRVYCQEGDDVDTPWFGLVEAGIQDVRYIDGKDLPIAPGMMKGIMWAKTGTFNGRKVVIFQSFEAVQFSVFLD